MRATGMWQRFPTRRFLDTHFPPPEPLKDPMRTLKTSLLFLLTFAPAWAFAQDAEPELAGPSGPAELDPEPPPAPPVSASAGATVALPPPPGPVVAAPAPVEPPAPTFSAPRSRGGGPESGKWTFNYAGYFRAPMRIGIGQTGGPQFVDPVTNPDGNVPAYTFDAAGNPVQMTDANGVPQYYSPKLTLHSPVIPDDQYTSWQFTGHNKKDWAEMFFSVGNGMVSGNVAIQAFRFTDATWADTVAQFGIGQGWVEINHDLGFENLKFNAKVGSHWNRYGMAGVYDSGQFDTYIVARTHVLGGTARADVDLGGATVGLEGGVGVNEPNPDMHNRTRFTTLAHGHGFLKLPGVALGLHILHAWATGDSVTNYPARLPSYQAEEYNYNAPGNLGGFLGGVNGFRGVWGPEYPNGSQTVAGLDAKFDLGMFGYLFAGYSHMFLSNALTVGDAIESVHSMGGGEYNIGAVDNYLESPYCPTFSPGGRDATRNKSCSNGTGNIGSAMVQYEVGLANFGLFPGAQDLKLALYGMLNFVSVDPIEQTRLQGVLTSAQNTLAAQGIDPNSITMNDISQNGAIKVKFGADAEFFFNDWLSLAVRADHVRPNNKIAGQIFTVLSPRIVFRTQAVTHEQISLSYSHYFYEQRQCQTTNAAGQIVVASPAAEPFPMAGSPVEGLYDQANPNTGLPLRVNCTQPAPSGSYPAGFGMYPSNAVVNGQRGATTLLPDENVVKLEASIWW